MEIGDTNEVVIGRGAGARLVVDDQAWPAAGRVRVARVGASFQATNEMTYTVVIGDQHLGHGDRTVWYTGVDLRVTQNTILSLRTAADPMAEAGVAEAEAWRTYASIGVILIAVPVVAIAFLFDPGPGLAGRPVSPAEVRTEYVGLAADLEAAADRPGGQAAAAALAELRAARLDELSGHRDLARERYTAVRETVDAALARSAGRPSPNDDALTRTQVFVNDRLVVLAEKPSRDR